MRLGVYNGPNLDRVGERSRDQYGATTERVEQTIERTAQELGVEWELFQTNHEGEMVERIRDDAVDGIVMNPAAWTHYSVAIRDTVAMIDRPVVEIHLSNIPERGEDIDWRDRSVIAPVCLGQITGFGVTSYELGMRAVYRELECSDNY